MRRRSGPGRAWGERPKAFVTLKEGADVSQEEIVAFCRERLAHFKCPKQVAFGPLPKMSTGKVEKLISRSRSGSATTPHQLAASSVRACS